LTYTPPSIADAIAVGSSPVLVAGTAQVGGSGQLQNAGQLPCWYGTTNTVTPGTGILLPVGGAPIQLASGTNYYCVANAGAPTSVLVNTWVSNVPGSGGSTGTGVSPLMAPVGIAASGSWSSATTTTVALSGTNCPMNAGDLVLVAVDEFLFSGAPPSVSAIADTNGNSWTKIKRSVTTAAGSFVNCATEIWYTIVTVPGATTLTFTISAASGNGQIAVLEFAKTLGSNWAVDVSGTGGTGSSTTGSNSIAFPALTPTNPFEMYIGTFANTGSPGSATYPSAYSVSYPFVYNTLVSGPQSPAISVQNNVIWATVGVCIGVFTPNGNATLLQGTAVATTAPTSGQNLQYNGTQWVPVTGSAGNATSIQGNPVSAAAPSNGQVLQWNGSSYVPTTPNTTNATSIQGVAVSAAAPSSGQVLEYNGTNWLPVTPAGGGTGEPLVFNTVPSASGALTLANPTTAQINWYTLSGNVTLTMPTLAAGDWCWLWVDQQVGGVDTLSFSASPPIRWVGGTAPTQPGSGQRLLVGFQCDGVNWLGTIISNGF
jgi:hypothetical protein